MERERIPLPRHIEIATVNVLLLARLMDQYLLSGVCRLSSSVTLQAGRPAAGRMGGRAVDTARRATTVTSR